MGIITDSEKRQLSSEAKQQSLATKLETFFTESLAFDTVL